MAEISGQIIAVLPTRSGTSAKGTAWSSQTAVIETREQYPKKVAFDVMGEKIAQFNLQVGEYVTVSYDIDAHEYQGRWFNAVRAWNVVRANQPQQATQQPQQQQQHATTESLGLATFFSINAFVFFTTIIPITSQQFNK